jgi:transposase
VLLLQVFYSVRSEWLMVEQIDCNLLFRWFVGLGMDDAVWNHAALSRTATGCLLPMWRSSSLPK